MDVAEAIRVALLPENRMERILSIDGPNVGGYVEGTQVSFDVLDRDDRCTYRYRIFYWELGKILYTAYADDLDVTADGDDLRIVLKDAKLHFDDRKHPSRDTVTMPLSTLRRVTWCWPGPEVWSADQPEPPAVQEVQESVIVRRKGMTLEDWGLSL